MQTSRGQYRSSLIRAAVRDWSLQYVSFEEGASICAGDAPKNSHTVLVPLAHAPRCRLLGEELNPGMIAVYAPGSEHADATNAGCEFVVIVVPDEFVRRADELGIALPRVGSQLQFNPGDRIDRLQQLLRSIPPALDTLRACGAQEEAEAGLSDALSRALAGTLGSHSCAAGRDVFSPGRPRMPRSAILRRIAEILKERSNEPIHASDLAAGVGISQPSLQRVFHEWYGMPPARYLGLKRLYVARRRLREQKDETVTQIAGTLGFWDQSRFSKAYKMLFGELPSETRRAAGRS